ncbi:hypothetical protein [Hymenobacter sp. B81]|uniref:hypothetical protein n=1 Tax=Hymenobacter sp. B81 TaxID=3344878 RepID=UPI0037DD2C9C
MQAATLTATPLELEIRAALAEPDPVLANLKITRCHYLLSEALQRVLGADAGANFHSWAVWGSRKAGVAIRQEDLDQARRDGTVVGGIVGALVGLGCGWLLGFPPLALPAGTLLGLGCGAAAGRWIIRRSRRVSARLILAGNRTVLEDIGQQTARFVARFTGPADLTPAAEAEFLARLRPGPAGHGGQELLHQAFQQYCTAGRATDPTRKQEAAYLANCFAVWHEHLRLEPYIRGAMPLIIRRCVTQRLLQFDIGPRRLAVAQDVPLPTPLLPLSAEQAPAIALLGSVGGPLASQETPSVATAAHDWTRIQERMRYVFALFRAFHTDAQVLTAPYAPPQLAAIAAGQHPAGTL